MTCQRNAAGPEYIQQVSRIFPWQASTSKLWNSPFHNVQVRHDDRFEIRIMLCFLRGNLHEPGAVWKHCLIVPRVTEVGCMEAIGEVGKATFRTEFNLHFRISKVKIRAPRSNVLWFPQCFLAWEPRPHYGPRLALPTQGRKSLTRDPIGVPCNLWGLGLSRHGGATQRHQQ